MFIAQPLHAFQLHHQHVLHQDIGKILAHRLSLISNHHRRLRRRPYPPSPQLSHQSPLIHLLQKPAPQCIRNLKHRPQHPLGQFLHSLFHLSFVFPSSAFSRLFLIRVHPCSSVAILLVVFPTTAAPPFP